MNKELLNVTNSWCNVNKQLIKQRALLLCSNFSENGIFGQKISFWHCVMPCLCAVPCVRYLKVDFISLTDRYIVSESLFLQILPYLNTNYVLQRLWKGSSFEKMKIRFFFKKKSRRGLGLHPKFFHPLGDFYCHTVLKSKILSKKVDKLVRLAEFWNVSLGILELGEVSFGILDLG